VAAERDMRKRETRTHSVKKVEDVLIAGKLSRRKWCGGHTGIGLVWMRAERGMGAVVVE